MSIYLDQLVFYPEFLSVFFSVLFCIVFVFSHEFYDDRKCITLIKFIEHEINKNKHNIQRKKQQNFHLDEMRWSMWNEIEAMNSWNEFT